MKKILLWLVVLLVGISMVATFSLVGCKEKAAAEETTAAVEETTAVVEEKPVTLEVWHMWHEPSTNAVYDELAGEFMEANPNVTIKSTVVPFEEASKVVKMALTTGTGPDVLHGGIFISELPLYVSEGLLLSLTDIAKQYKWYDRIPKSQIEFCSRDFLPEIYSIALDTEVAGVWYNKEIFSDLGLTPPMTWVEFENVINTVLEAGYQPFVLGNLDMWPGNLIIDSLIVGKVSMDDINEYKDLSGKVAYTDKGLLEAAKLAQEWGTKGYFGKDFNSIGYDDSFSQFYTKKAAMYIMGNWAIDALDENASFDYGFFLMPPSDPNLPLAAIGAPGNGYNIIKKAEENGKAGIAAKFVDLLLSKHAAEKFFEAGKIVGVEIDTTGLKGKRAQGEVVEALKILGESQGGLAGFYSDSWIRSSEIVWPLVQELLSGQITPEDYSQQLQEEYVKDCKE